MYGMSSNTDPDACYFLGDSAGYRTWSCVSGKIPTLRMTGGLYWWPFLGRFSVPKEKLLFLGFPVEPCYATSLDVPLVGAADEHRASELAGNAMHLPSVALVELIALSCFCKRSDV